MTGERKVTLTLADVDQMDAAIGAISDYGATARLIGEASKGFDDDTATALERLGENIRISVEQVRALRDRLWTAPS